MKSIHYDKIVNTVARMCIDANCVLNNDIREAINESAKREESPVGKAILQKLIVNADIAKEKQIPVCQDTGMAVFFVKVGQELHIEGGLLTDAINDGVRKGYADGFLRKSIVKDPLNRVNTKDNTPAVIHYDIVDGDMLDITIAPKGFGSENMSAVRMLKPADGVEGVIGFVLETVEKAGSNPCPPMVIGVGIGGTLEKSCLLAKTALTRNVGEHNPDKFYADLEKELLERINRLGIGPQGLGGTTTAICVNIETFPTHIAGLPVAVNINCHATRHVNMVL